MSRIRTIKPEFFVSETLASVPRDARLLFIGLWPHCDDYGAILDSPRRILGEVFPHDKDLTEADIDRMLEDLAFANLIVRFRTKFASIIAIPEWHEFQKVDKPGKVRACTKEELFEAIASMSLHPRETFATVSRLDLGSRTLDLGPPTSYLGPPTNARGGEVSGDSRSTPAIGIHAKPSPEAVAAASPWQQPANPSAPPPPPPPSNPHLCTILPNNGQILTTSETFRRFWEAYPKKDGKAAAAVAWNLAITRDNADPEHMIYAASREPSANKTGDEAKYRPSPSKWLEDGKYLAVQPIPKPKPIDPEMAAIIAERRKAAEQAEAERQARSKAEMEALWASPAYAKFKESIGVKA